MPVPICNDQGDRSDTPCQEIARLVVHLFDNRHLACAPHAEATRDDHTPGEVAVYALAYDAEHSLATWTEGDQPHMAMVIGLPDGGTALRRLSPQAELRCLTCDVAEFTATGRVPVSIRMDTEEAASPPSRCWRTRLIRPPAFGAGTATRPMST